MLFDRHRAKPFVRDRQRRQKAQGEKWRFQNWAVSWSKPLQEEDLFWKLHWYITDSLVSRTDLDQRRKCALFWPQVSISIVALEHWAEKKGLVSTSPAGDKLGLGSFTEDSEQLSSRSWVGPSPDGVFHAWSTGTQRGDFEFPSLGVWGLRGRSSLGPGLLGLLWSIHQRRLFGLGLSQ